MVTGDFMDTYFLLEDHEVMSLEIYISCYLTITRCNGHRHYCIMYTLATLW